jgi:hypothetical protein
VSCVVNVPAPFRVNRLSAGELIRRTGMLFGDVVLMFLVLHTSKIPPDSFTSMYSIRFGCILSVIVLDGAE